MLYWIYIIKYLNMEDKNIKDILSESKEKEILQKEINRKESVIVKLQDKYHSLERKHGVQKLQKFWYFIGGFLLAHLLRILF